MTEFKDENGNVWTDDWLQQNGITFEEAKDSLKNCHNCVDCIFCEDCIGCMMCIDCYKCVYCWECKDCGECKQCLDCSHCSNCDNCKDCNYCTYCGYCKYCVDCDNCAHLKVVEDKKNYDGTLIEITIDIKDDCIFKDVKHFIDRLQKEYSILIDYVINDILTFKLNFKIRAGSIRYEKRVIDLKYLFSKYDDIIDDYEIKVAE